MDRMSYILFVSIFVPMVLMVFLVEKKAQKPLVFFLIGMFVSLFASEVNGLLLRLFPMASSEFTATVTPITEEVMKAVPVLFYAFVVTDKKETLFTLSLAVGIGFAILENAYVLLENAGEFQLLTAVVRGFGTGLMHGMCTLLVGYGITFVKAKRKRIIPGVFALLSAAITYHAIFNLLIQSRYRVAGMMLPIVTYLLFVIRRYDIRKQKNMF